MGPLFAAFRQGGDLSLYHGRHDRRRTHPDESGRNVFAFSLRKKQNPPGRSLWGAAVRNDRRTGNRVFM